MTRECSISLRVLCTECIAWCNTWCSYVYERALYYRSVQSFLVPIIDYVKKIMTLIEKKKTDVDIRPDRIQQILQIIVHKNVYIIGLTVYLRPN